MLLESLKAAHMSPDGNPYYIGRAAAAALEARGRRNAIESGAVTRLINEVAARMASSVEAIRNGAAKGE